MRVITGGHINALVAEYLHQRINLTLTTPFIAFAVYSEDGKFVAGVIASNFRDTDCEISMAAETANWARKGVMKYILGYIFNTMGCVRCTCVVQNVKASRRTRRFLEGIGFVLEGNLRLAYDGRTDALIYGLLGRECRFLEGNRGVPSGEKVRA